MHVDGKIFYHIQRKPCQHAEWSVGEKYEIGKNHNLFFSFYNTYESKISIGQSQPELHLIRAWEVLNKDERGKIKDHNDLIKKAFVDLKERCSYIREIVFDDVRKELEKQRIKQGLSLIPSRKACVWLIDDVGIEYWKIKLGENSQNNLFKVRCFGYIHRADPEINFPADTISVNELRQYAKRYWTFQNTPKETDEILFEGTLEVLEILPN